MNTRRAWIPAAALLGVVYLMTAAPDVTFWDAGEFIAAARSFGIPHPPGTPLFVLLLNVWGRMWPDAIYAAGLNLFSAVCTCAAAALSASLVARWLAREPGNDFGVVAGIAAAICAGTMSSVWSNATETEVYAASLLLAVLMMFAADRAGRSGDRRWMILLTYAFGLAAPLHASALVAAPAAILLAVTAESGEMDFRAGALLCAAALLAMALATLSPMFFIAAGVVAGAAGFVIRWHGRTRSETRRAILPLVLPVVIGATPLLVMLLRARFDPAINQGNPSTGAALADVIARRQYDLAGLWPRRAPIWIQLGNWFEYADWQTALSLGPTVIPTVARVLASIVFGALAVFGSLAHRRADRRTWRALLVLFVAGSLGVILYLNLRASPSFGWGILPDNADREARERDYFFVLGFWTVGLWAGVGAVAAARRLRWPLAAGLAVAELTVLLNWKAIERRGVPESVLPREAAERLLLSVPPNSVLFVEGDNDTYPVWYAQRVLGLRRDVSVITLPLLGADWYDREVIRRNPLLHLTGRSGDPAPEIVTAARDAGRPVAAALMLGASDRARLHGCWSAIGFALIDVSDGRCERESGSDSIHTVDVDTIRTIRWVERFELRSAGWALKPTIDPTGEYYLRMLGCPRQLLDAARRNGRSVSLDSTCNP